jgi:hypothetical protein
MRQRVGIGQQFGRWTVIGEALSRRSPSGYYFAYWLCRCECGAQMPVRQQHLLSGRTRSCGCLRSEAAAEQKTTHGGRHTPLYEVWTQMLQRCGNSNNKRFKAYGGRGISVCAEWHEFEAFRHWAVANGYAAGLTIDREDNDGDYVPGNCRWVPSLANCRNNSITLKVSWDGVKVALNTLAESHGLKAGTVYSRYKLKGWTLRQALGLDAAPAVVRPPISELTRQRMRESALVREAANRKCRL